MSRARCFKWKSPAIEPGFLLPERIYPDSGLSRIKKKPAIAAGFRMVRCSGRQSADTTLIPVDAWARFCGAGLAAGAASVGWDGDEGLNRSLTPENILL